MWFFSKKKSFGRLRKTAIFAILAENSQPKKHNTNFCTKKSSETNIKLG